MATTQGNRSLRDLMQWETLATPLMVPTTSGEECGSCDHIRQFVVMQNSASTLTIYDPHSDSSVDTSAGGGSWGGGAITFSAWSTGSTVGVASLTATSGTTSTIVTNQTLYRSLNGFPIHIMEGPNAGAILTITSNTIGANSTITVPTQAVAFDNTTKFRLGTWRVYIPTTSQAFRCYDYATDSLLTLSTTGWPNTGSRIGATTTPSWIGTGINAFATGTATSATATTLVNSGKAWTTNQWTNYQVRITSGTGAGQIRTVSSNTGTTLTVPSWTITPDSTSQYSIEGNDDFLWVFGLGSTATYRYSISANTWTTVAASGRGGSPTSNCPAFWMGDVTDPTWNVENNIINGRRIYSPRGTTGVFDVYDIALGTWSAIQPAHIRTSFFGSRATFAKAGSTIFCAYDMTVGTSPIRTIKFDVTAMNYEPWVQIPAGFATGTQAGSGNNMFAVRFRDGATTIPYVYQRSMSTTNNAMMRCMVI